ncbi:uncharacterized protein LOC110713729 [Chenopodium quinoa]|uniref:uncharacterized protein LOC110713729 n=1 Tax=Chenopodium quinoa TaxID=63459 RepID=UPI000B795AC7|nr:uncharacterized protein LOC110713729 [Chenopodium quinoa]
MEQGKKETKRVLITFDIDRTFIRSTGPNSNHLHRQAFSHALLQVFGIDGTIDVIQHHGSTDPAILVNTLVHYGIPSEVSTEKLSDLKSKMIEYAKGHAKDIGEGLEVTGNLEEVAWMKMEGLGIEKYFSVPHIGGFGSDHIDRGHLVKIAAERAEKLFPGKFDLRVHVGDTPNDIRAAEFGGALAIGVCTGIFGKEELDPASTGGAVVLQNLSDCESFLNLLGL